MNPRQPEQDTQKKKKKPTNTASIVDAAVLLIGASAGVTLATFGPLRSSQAAVAPEVALPASASIERTSHNDCLGQEAIGELELVPDMVRRSAVGRERVDYHADLHLNRGKNAGVSWRFDILDDRGTMVRSAVTEGTARGSGGDTLTTTSAGADLPDGFYALRLRAAIVGDDVSDVLEAIQHVQVAGGLWRELTADEWYTESAYTLALPLPSDTILPAQLDNGITPGGAQ